MTKYTGKWRDTFFMNNFKKENNLEMVLFLSESVFQKTSDLRDIIYQ